MPWLVAYVISALFSCSGLFFVVAVSLPFVRSLSEKGRNLNKEQVNERKQRRKMRKKRKTVQK